MSDMDRPGDVDQRAAALDPRASFIVQSPAGSGKTELLSNRFLKLLAVVDQPQRVLAITFTRKATQEMLDRVLGRIRQASSGIQADTEHERAAGELAARVLERDREFGWNLLDNPSQLQIHTIDGLCARLASFGREAGTAVDSLRVSDDPQALHREAVRRLLERVSAAPGSAAADAVQQLLMRLRGSFEQLQGLLCRELERRDQWLGAVAGGLEEMSMVLERRQLVELQALAASLGADNLDVLAQCLRGLLAFADEPRNGAEFIDSLDAYTREPENAALQVRAMHCLLKAVAVKAGSPMAARTIKSKLFPGQGSAREELIKGIQGVCAAWGEDPGAASMFSRFVLNPPLDEHPDNEDLLWWMHELLLEACAELRVLFAEQGVCDFQHVAELALAAMGEDLAPGEALLLEDGRLGHILVDEFQDTSQMQYRLLEKLTAGWEPGDGRSLFLVGDPMQSIYRFRKAEVALFNRVFTEACLGSVQLQALRLVANFRSKPAVIDFVNQQFPAIFQPPSPAATGAVRYVAVQAQRLDGGEVVLHPNHESIGAEGEAQEIAALVHALQAENPDIRIGVLGRVRRQLAPVAAVLDRSEIPFEAVDVQVLDRQPVVQELLTLTRALLHPADRIAWLALLQGPCCGLTPAQLHDAAGEDFDTDILLRLHDNKIIDALGPLAGPRLEHFQQVMQQAVEAAGRCSLQRRVEAAWIRLHGPCVAQNLVDLDNAQAFLELLAGVEAEQPEDLLDALHNRLQRLYAGARPSSVQLMTIHKAKGLEFDAVILPGLEARGGKPEHVLFRQQQLSFPDGLEGALLAPVKPAGASGPSLFEYLRELENEAEACEAQRVLYVALTRARDSLHLFGRWKMTGTGNKRAPSADKRSFMHLLWPEFRAQIERLGQQEMGLVEPGADAPDILPMLCLEGTPPLAIAPVQTALQDGELSPGLLERDALAFGQAYHLWLELIHDHWSEAWQEDWLPGHRPALEASLVNAGARAESLQDLADRLTMALRDSLGNEQLFAAVSPEGKSASFAELAFCQPAGERLEQRVIDRVFRHQDGNWTIIDYKTTERPEAAREDWSRQLGGYRRLVEQWFDEPVSSCRVFSAGTLSFEEIPTED